VFVGRHARNLDRKSRLALPAEFVNRLQPDDRSEVYVTPGKKGCIWLVPKSFWETEFERLAAEYDSDIPDEFYHHCRLRPVDKAGRVLLDEDTRELAELSDPAAGDPVAVMVCGSGRYLQVWCKARYEDRARSPRDFARSLPARGGAGTE
jgi:DNA-binding transcriptional regulator/RsmH inhibitor MraZ